MADTSFTWTGGYGQATPATLGQTGSIPPTKGITMPNFAKTTITLNERKKTNAEGREVLTIKDGKATGDPGEVLAWKSQQEITKRALDPRFQTALVAPQAKKEELRPIPPALTRLLGRLQTIKSKTGDSLARMAKENIPGAAMAFRRAEDIMIGLGDAAKNILGVEKTGVGEEEQLAAQMSAAGLHREAAEMMEQVQERKINAMTERQIEETLHPPSRAEKIAAGITRGTAEFIPSLLIAKGAGSRRLAGSALKNLAAQEAAESFAFAASKIDLENKPLEQLPEDFWNDFKFAFPSAVGLRLSGSALGAAAGAFRNLLSAARRQNIELSPSAIKEGLSGVPNEDFAKSWNLLSEPERATIEDLWSQQRLIGEARPIFLRDPNLNPGKVNPERMPKRTIPRSDVPQVFRTDKLNLTPDELMRVNAHFEALGLQTRGVQTFDQVKELADELGIDPVGLVTGIKNNNLKAEQVLALRDTINHSAGYLSTTNQLLEEAILPAEKDLILSRIAQHEQLIDDAITKLVKGGTQAGRTVSAYRLIARNTMDPAYWLKEAKRVMGDQKITEDVVLAINDLIRKKDQLGLSYFVAGLRKSDNIEKVITLWKAGLLTSPTTHLANFMGNTTMQSLETIKDIPATIMDWGIGIKTGVRTKGLTFQGFVEQGKGLMEGGDKALQYLKTGIDADHALTKYDIPRTVNYNNAFLQTYTDLVFRSLGSTDKLFREGVLRKSLYEQAHVKALNLTPAQVREIAADLSSEYGENVSRADITEYFFKNADDAMARQAINDAEYATFMNENTLATWISSGKRTKSVPMRVGLELTIPFAKTPANVASAMIDYSPLGFLKMISKGLKKDQRGFVEAFGRGVTGTSVIALGAALARDGLMTASLPTTAKERELWQLNGISQQSIFVAGKWRRLDRMSPLGNLLAIGAEYNRFGKDRTQMDRLSSTAYGGLKGLTEQSFLRGISQALKAVNEPDRFAKSAIENTVAGLVPTILGRIAQGLDTNQRDPDTLLQVIQGRIPILAENNPVKKDVFGRDVKNRSGFFARIFDPLSSSAPTGDPVAGELFRLHNPVSSPSKGLYSNQEYRDLLELRGKILYPTLYQIMSSPEWQGKMTDDEKRYAIDAISAATTQQANAFMKQKLAARLSQELAEMSPNDRDIRFREIRERDQTTSLYIENLYKTQPEFER